MIRNLLYEATVVKRKLPENIREEDIKFFKPELERNTYPVYEDIIDNALVTLEGLAYYKGKLVKDSLLDSKNEEWFPYGYYFLQKILKKKIRQKNNEPFVLCFNYWSDGYFHWITEVLPRLLCVKSELSNASVLLPRIWNGIYNRQSALLRTLRPRDNKPQPPEFYEKSLAPFQIKSFHYIAANTYIITDKLKLVSQPAPTGNYNVALMKQVRTLYHNYYVKETEQKKYPKRIYISRKKALRRKIANEDEVTALLLRHNFEVVFFEDMAFDEQIKYAYYSDYIISMHGAGLTNILFMKAGSKVLELSSVDPAVRNLCYYSLADAVEVKYYYQFCRKADESLNVQNADIFVDLKQLEANLQLFLAE